MKNVLIWAFFKLIFKLVLNNFKPFYGLLWTACCCPQVAPKPWMTLKLLLKNWCVDQLNSVLLHHYRLQTRQVSGYLVVRSYFYEASFNLQRAFCLKVNRCFNGCFCEKVSAFAKLRKLSFYWWLNKNNNKKRLARTSYVVACAIKFANKFLKHIYLFYFVFFVSEILRIYYIGMKGKFDHNVNKQV